jgi:hypothetical protein
MLQYVKHILDMKYEHGRTEDTVYVSKITPRVRNMEQYYIRDKHQQSRGTWCIRNQTSGGGEKHNLRGNEDG